MSLLISVTPSVRFRRVLDWVCLLLGSLAVIGRFLELHTLLAPAVAPALAVLQAAPLHEPTAGFGWWSWSDQRFYLESALAWAQGNLDPGLHWYVPGYPLLGAAFTRLTPADPFMVPDLLCMLAALWLFAAISAEVSLGRALGACLFVATSAVPKRVMEAWIVPWTTTPATVCLLTCLLGTLRLARRPNPRDALLAGFAAAATLAFRPADGAVVGAVSAAASGVALLVYWPGWVAARRIVGAALAGAAVPLAVFGAAYLVVDGLRSDGYLVSSAAYGFEWRLLPLRWVTLMVDPKPLFIDGQGLAQVFPWIVTGLAGMLACLVRPRRTGLPRLAHCVLAGAVLADTIQFLCYRDLHPDYLWQNGVYHYFKWTLPVFGLYSLLLLRALLFGPRLAPTLALAAVLPGLFAWRVGLTDAVALPPPVDSQTLLLPQGLPRLDDVLLVRTQPGETAMVAFGTTMSSAGRSFASPYDFKLTPWSKTLMVQPLRRMPDAPATLRFDAGTYSLDPSATPMLARAALAWGVPCWLHPDRPACQTAFLLPAPVLPLTDAVALGTGQVGEIYRLAGLATAEPAGDWTDGAHAALWFRLPPGVAGPFALDLTAAGFAPVGDPARVTATANGVAAGQGAFGRDPGTVRFIIPSAAIRPDGNVVFGLAIADPRTPTHYSATSDTRALGIQIRALRVTPAP